ncbi:alpha/beta hydrolase [Kribbella capetownensis]|uniref:Alpha/beta hydrolase n=1 Tax=Kribbella capetownensis TaxID=1572659 RepID=A0A4R0JLB5_9ACTN|nr:alpha/beta hydrolase [Kribbella capetownensis]TCC47429.1 alpha/beta hydrolase [Kribbella capetownensis]
MPVHKTGRFVSDEGRAVFDAAYDEGLRALPEPVDVRDLATTFGQVRTYRFGKSPGTPLLLLHGRGGTTVMLQPNIAELAERRTVYALDMLGEAGRNNQTAPLRNAEDQATWLSEVLAGLGPERFHLAGISVGGWSGCNLAVRDPERLASLALFDPVQTFGRIRFAVVLRTIPTLIPFTAKRAVPSFLKYVDGQGGELPQSDPVAKVIDASLRYYRPGVPPPSFFTDEQLRGLSLPTLAVIAGRTVMHDPNRAVGRARRLVPNIEAELWPEATHAISGQCARKVNSRLLTFMDTVDAMTGR